MLRLAMARPERSMDLTTDWVENHGPRTVVELNEVTAVEKRLVEDQGEFLAEIVADAERRAAVATVTAGTAGNLQFPWGEWNSCGQRTEWGLNELTEIAVAGNMIVMCQRS